MRPFASAGCILISMALAFEPAPGGTWYVPIEEQVPGGFDHIQIRMLYPYQFDTPAMSAFCGPSPVGEEWAETFLNPSRVFATADGPDPGDDAIHFAVWIAGDPQADRPAFHFQTYKGPTMVDNADFICSGPGELDWMVAPGTWEQRSPIPPWIPGDANYDAFVDGLDYNIWSLHYKQPGGWGEGDFNLDGFVDGLDYNIWSLHYTGPCGSRGAGAGLAQDGIAGSVPEPGTISLVALGVFVALSGRRRAR